METTQTNVIELTDKAKSQLLELEVSKDNFLRLWIVAGGCQGFSYQAAIDDAMAMDDRVLYEDTAFRVVTDPESYEYLPGLVIDYSDDLAKAGFRFQNPNAKASCGCGSSFCTN